MWRKQGVSVVEHSVCVLRINAALLEHTVEKKMWGWVRLCRKAEMGSQTPFSTSQIFLSHTYKQHLATFSSS